MIASRGADDCRSPYLWVVTAHHQHATVCTARVRRGQVPTVATVCVAYGTPDPRKLLTDCRRLLTGRSSCASRHRYPSLSPCFPAYGVTPCDGRGRRFYAPRHPWLSSPCSVSYGVQAHDSRYVCATVATEGFDGRPATVARAAFEPVRAARKWIV